MPNKPIDESWREYIRELAANNPRKGAYRLQQKAEREGVERDLDPTGVPSRRTVGTIIKEVRDWPREKRTPYQYFRWPESMESGALPWEASAAALQLLAYLDTHTNGHSRPTVGVARWYWRVLQAVPDISDAAAYAAAVTIATHRAVNRPLPEGLEHWLAYGAYRTSVERRKALYDAATKRKENPITGYASLQAHVALGAGAGPDASFEINASFNKLAAELGMTPEELEQFLKERAGQHRGKKGADDAEG